MFYFLPDDPDLRRRTIDQLVWQLDVDIKRLWKRVEQAPGHHLGELPLRPRIVTDVTSSESSSEGCIYGVPHKHLVATLRGFSGTGCSDCEAVNGTAVPVTSGQSGPCYTVHTQVDLGAFAVVCGYGFSLFVTSGTGFYEVNLSVGGYLVQFRSTDTSLPSVATFHWAMPDTPSLCDWESAYVEIDLPASSGSTS